MDKVVRNYRGSIDRQPATNYTVINLLMYILTRVAAENAAFTFYIVHKRYPKKLTINGRQQKRQHDGRKAQVQYDARQQKSQRI